MSKIKKSNENILQILFVIIFIFFSTLHAKDVHKFENTYSASSYFSGVLNLNENLYEQSHSYFRKLDGLEEIHPVFSAKYLTSSILSGKIFDAFKYSQNLEKKNLDNFESNLIMGVHYLKLKNYKLSKKYFQYAENKSNFVLDKFISISLNNLSSINNINLIQAEYNLNKISDNFSNFKNIQKAFLYCYFQSKETDKAFKNLILNQNTDLSRYNFFYANYLISLEKFFEAKKVINFALEKNPRNLLLNQYKINLENKFNKKIFDCQKPEHIAAEILYVVANVYSSERSYVLSNFYLSLAKYLNDQFFSFDTLMAENYSDSDNLAEAKKIFKSLEKKGSTFYWYSGKQISRILIKQEAKEKAVKYIKNSFRNLSKKNVYDIFDYAEFLKNNELFEESINFYTEILNIIKEDHPLYPEVTDGRGVAYERIGEWNKAEKDLLSSLAAKPNQAYVINYLAYSWIEKNIKVEESLAMLEKANKLKSNDPYITDSLGWALFKLKRYDEAKDYLQLAVNLMPGDPIVNDHFGDVLWKRGKKIQARYYWNYVLNLSETKEELKKKVERKLVSGLKN